MGAGLTTYRSRTCGISPSEISACTLTITFFHVHSFVCLFIRVCRSFAMLQAQCKRADWSAWPADFVWLIGHPHRLDLVKRKEGETRIHSCVYFEPDSSLLHHLDDTLLPSFSLFFSFVLSLSFVNKRRNRSRNLDTPVSTSSCDSEIIQARVWSFISYISKLFFAHFYFFSINNNLKKYYKLL